MPRFAYPLLKRVAELYAGANLEKVLLLASQHLLEPQLEMFSTLFLLGLKPGDCIIAGKGYSTNKGVMNNLAAKGCIVAPFSADFDRLRSFESWFEENLTAFVGEELAKRRLSGYQKIIVLDDGGFMHIVVDGLIGSSPNVVGIEQTSSGYHMIGASTIRFKTAHVARLSHKLVFESPHIGSNGRIRIIRHLKQRGKKNPRILVMGLGAIGRQVAGQLFLLEKYDGYAADARANDPRVRDHSVTQLLGNLRKLIPAEEAMRRIGDFDVVVGATGSPLFDEDRIRWLHPEVSLISMSSSDREFPVVPFRRLEPAGGIHDDYYLGERCLVNGGFPITFDGQPHAMPPQQIEFTVALMMIRLLDEVSNHRLQKVPDITEQIRSLWEPLEGAEQWYEDNLK